MSLPNKFQLARMTDATLGSSIDDKVGELEQAICDILGISIETETAKAILGAVDSEGRITSPLRLYRADSDASTGAVTGIRLRDEASPNDQEGLITVEDDYLRIYTNAGTEASPIWTERNTLDLNTGLWSASDNFLTLVDSPASYTNWAYAAPVVNLVENALEFQLGRGCSLYRNGAQSHTATGWETLDWNAETFDLGSFHSVSTNPTRITVPVDGVYCVRAMVYFATNATGVRQLAVHVDGSGTSSFVGPEVDARAGNNTYMQVTGLLSLLAGQYFEINAYQSSGGALNMYGNCFVNLER